MSVTELALDVFEGEVMAFLDANAERAKPRGFHPWSADSETVQRSKEWQHTKFNAGLGWIMGPAEFGGRELSIEHDRLYRRLEAQFDVPTTGPLDFGLTIVGSCILTHGTKVARDKYLRALYSGEIAACQLYSEPGAGSDLAGVATRAVRDGERWILNGQKVWTSNAHTHDVGQCVCRTDVNAPKHKGITLFMVDMRAPGVEVRPLRDAGGSVHFDEVFLTDVVVRDEDRLGPVDDGWRTLNTSLMNERSYVGALNEGRGDILGPNDLIATLRSSGLLTDPAVRDGLAEVVIRFKVGEYFSKHARQRLERGEEPGAEMSISKLMFSENQRELAKFAAESLGPRITARFDDELDWATALVKSLAFSIAGGSDEIQKDILGERVLGLPRDPSSDSKVPYRDIPRSTGGNS